MLPADSIPGPLPAAQHQPSGLESACAFCNPAYHTAYAPAPATPEPSTHHSHTPCPPLQNDSIEGIYDTLKECAGISKSAGGIGLSIHNIRATGSYIRGTNGTSNGIVPMLRVFNDTARYVDQVGAAAG